MAGYILTLISSMLQWTLNDLWRADELLFWCYVLDLMALPKKSKTAQARRAAMEKSVTDNRPFWKNDRDSVEMLKSELEDQLMALRVKLRFMKRRRSAMVMAALMITAGNGGLGFRRHLEPYGTTKQRCSRHVMDTGKTSRTAKRYADAGELSTE